MIIPRGKICHQLHSVLVALLRMELNPQNIVGTYNGRELITMRRRCCDVVALLATKMVGMAEVESRVGSKVGEQVCDAS